MTDIGYEVLLPEGWNRPRGYANAVSTTGKKTIRIAGQLPAVDGHLPVKPGLSVGEQWEIALSNVVSIVKSAGGTVENIVSLRVYVTDMKEYREAVAAIGAAWKNTLGRHFPAMTLVGVASLVDDNAKVEIECEAVLA